MRWEACGRRDLPRFSGQRPLVPLTGLAGLRIILAGIEDEVMRRVGTRDQPDPTSSCVRGGQQPHTNVPFSQHAYHGTFPSSMIIRTRDQLDRIDHIPLFWTYIAASSFSMGAPIIFPHSVHEPS